MSLIDAVHTAHQTDHDLMERFRNSHERTYLARLLLRYHHHVVLLCRRYGHQETDPADVLESVLQAMEQKLRREWISDFKDWLYAETQRACRRNTPPDHVSSTSSGRIRRLPLRNLPDLSEQEVKSALEKLSAHRRELLKHFLEKELPLTEVAAAYGKEEAEVQETLQKTRTQLLKNLKDRS